VKVSENVDLLAAHALRAQVDPARRVATLTLDDEPHFNRLPYPGRAIVAQVFEEFTADERVRVIVLRGAGDKAFSAGGNIAQFMEATPEQLSDLAHNIAAPERCPKPVIARLTGYTFGVGLEISLACDFRIASDTTQLALPEITLGMIPGSGGSQRIARIAGLGRAKDMVMRGRRVPAAEALAWGLLTSVQPVAELDAAVDGLIDELIALPAPALRAAKRVLNANYEAPLSIAMELEGREYGRLRSTPDFAEGVAAFGEKRKPRFPSHEEHAVANGAPR
jgi:2-oxoglutaroyl-CoA hydrolase